VLIGCFVKYLLTVVVNQQDLVNSIQTLRVLKIIIFNIPLTVMSVCCYRLRNVSRGYL
jgi:hypothetical protein